MPNTLRKKMKDLKIKAVVEEILKQDERIYNAEKDEFNNSLLFDLVDNYDEDLIDLLLNNEESRDRFFLKIKDVYVFKTNDFKFFIEEHKVDNSFTKYKNRIGLTDGRKFLKDTNDVVLDFPYKDCVLEGGQSTEEGLDNYYEWQKATLKDKLDEDCNKIKDGRKNIKEIDVPGHYEQTTTKRKEIFYNRVLAHDEIDRLFDEKALVNWKRFTKDGVSTSLNDLKIRRDENGTIKENMIIKGNNLLALHSLKKQFAGKVKLIYIDPPYNPPSQNNTFIYNNNFNKSTWLTFMKNRFEISKKLLTDDGVLIVAIDENEVHTLGIMINQVFKEYENHCITIVHNPRGVIGTNFSYTHEYAFFIFPKGKKIIGRRKIKEEDVDWRGLRDNGGESLRTDAKNCFYSIIVDKCTEQVIDFGEVCKSHIHPPINIHKGDFVKIYPVDKNGIERKWRYARQSVDEIKHLLRVKNNKGVYDIQMGKDFGTYRTVWNDKRYDANEYGTKIVNSLVNDNTFSFPKSLWNVYDCIYAVVGNDKNALVLDYHAGSGTTAHAVLELNKEDDGNRKFILVEQMDYINTVTCPRVKKVMEKENIDDSFLYFELAKWNEKAKEEILNCKSLKELEVLFDKLYDTYFLNYNLKIKEFKEKVIKEENFKNLPLDKQKEMFITMLDNNQMYVQKSEMEDAKYGISTEDQKMTEEFYGGNG
jgi:adenine-specific DNA-methyltransferase